jgi:hypothetical protein
VLLPVYQTLRMLDGNKPVIGKVYDKMFMLVDIIEKKSPAAWRALATKIHEDRWEYMHSDMHAAGYALDPEYLNTAGDLDAPTQMGLIKIIQRMSLRAVLLQQPDPEAAIEEEDEKNKITADSPEVPHALALGRSC